VQYVMVESRKELQVFVDGVVRGRTGEVLRVPEGVHEVRLEGKDPRRVVVVGTSPINPLRVTFS